MCPVSERVHLDPQRVWNHYVKWLRSSPPDVDLDTLFESYRSEMLANGVPVRETEKQLECIITRTRTDPQGWRLIFNKLYTGSKYSGMLPNAFLARVIERLPPGRALDVCMGDGRNSLFLAAHGWRVVGFDVAEQGLIKARNSAAHLGFGLRAVHVNEQAFCFGTGRWDLIVITYAPVALADPLFIGKVRKALRPGGAILIESFAFDPRMGRTRMVEIDPRGLLDALAGFEIEEFNDTESLPDWSTYPTRVVRLLARVP